MKRVAYLTGAPATGKSSLCRELRRRFPEVGVFEYGDELAKQISSKRDCVTQDQLREDSAAIITPEDVAELDMKLLNFVKSERLTRPVVIDSHAVTLERYGFRVLAFAESQIRSLNPDLIVCLQLSAAETIHRIKTESLGRPLPTPEIAERHTTLQSVVAINYGIIVGAPVYFLDSTATLASLAEQMMERLTT